MSKIYLDMDGVLVDFDKGLLDNHGVKNCLITYGTSDADKTPEQWELSKKVFSCMMTKEFFSRLPPMEGFLDLYNSAKKLTREVYVLTAFPTHKGEINTSVYRDKLDWCQIHLPNFDANNFIFCERKDKVKYAWTGQHYSGGSIGKSNILIDDLLLNCQEWEREGGEAILFKDRTMNEIIWNLERIYATN